MNPDIWVSEVNAIIQKFSPELKPIKKREQPTTLDAPYEILQLVGIYDLKAFHIGLLSFVHPIKTQNERWVFGKLEADYVVIEKDGKLAIRDRETAEQSWLVSSGSEGFLSATLIAIRFLHERANAPETCNGQEIAISIAERCAIAAGGKDFESFYLMLLGAD